MTYDATRLIHTALTTYGDLSVERIQHLQHSYRTEVTSQREESIRQRGESAAMGRKSIDTLSDASSDDDDGDDDDSSEAVEAEPSGEQHEVNMQE
jgi:hypothetical protein